MPTFAEELIAVRKKSHLTQEQLANEMNVSRQTISHWENGRAVPDIDTIKRLSQALAHNFLEVSGMNADEPSVLPTEEAPEVSATKPEESAENETVPTGDEGNAPAKKPNLRVLIPAVLGGVLLCAVLIVSLLMNDKPAGGQAIVSITPIENPVHAIRFEDFPDGVGWFYEFRIEETAGVPFTVHELASIVISENGTEDGHTFTGEQVAEWWGSNTLEQNIPQALTGGFPLQAVKGVRIVLNGTDANGNELTFEGSLELSKEIAE